MGVACDQSEEQKTATQERGRPARITTVRTWERGRPARTRTPAVRRP